MRLDNPRRVPVLCFVTLLLGWFVTVVSAFAADPSGEQKAQGTPNGAYHISGVKLEPSADAYRLTVKGSNPPTYTMYEMVEPLRVVLDIADADFARDLTFPIQPPGGPVSKIIGSLRNEKKPAIARLEIFLSEDRAYSVERVESDIVVSFTQPSSSAAAVPPAGLKGQPDTGSTGDSRNASEIHSLEVIKDPQETKLVFSADGPITDFTSAPLPKGKGVPDRLVIDVPNISLAGLPGTRTVETGALKQVRTAKRGNGARIVLDSNLNELFSFRIDKTPVGLEVIVQEPSPVDAVLATLVEKSDSGDKALASLPSDAAPGLQADLIRPGKGTTSVTGNGSSGEKKKSVKNDFGYAGYEKQKISVDFYKIDIHNVFRLFGEISGMNIVVDDKVTGTLSLTLNDVPWDFALDVIMNLKSLRKEERFNTVVIYPNPAKEEGFVWPKTTGSNLSFAPGEAPQEALSVKKRMEPPPAETEAKKLLLQAQAKEKQEDYAGALALYEEAFVKWPDNGQLVNRIASLCLVRLGINAKAVHYSKEALKLNGNDRYAALNAGIGLANMKKLASAETYFDLATGGTKPTSEALTSYSAFAEEQENYPKALRLLTKHDELYGDTLDTMIAKARIFDKQGEEGKALAEYRSILLSGFEVPADLSRFIKGRIALAEQRQNTGGGEAKPR